MSRVFLSMGPDQRLRRAALGMGALGRTAFWGRRGDQLARAASACRVLGRLFALLLSCARSWARPLSGVLPPLSSGWSWSCSQTWVPAL